MNHTNPKKPLTKKQAAAIKPGDTIIILINDKRVVTTIDKHGVQRLPCNPFIGQLPLA